MNQIEFVGKKIVFEQGLPGFEQLRDFLISKPFEELPFYYLHSLDAKEVSFLTVNPFELIELYEFELPLKIQQSLEIFDLSDVAVLNIVNLNNGFNDATVNLQAPVVINVKKNKGAQVVLNNSNFNIREPLNNLLQGMEV